MQQTITNEPGTRQGAVNALAIVGFIALVFAGMTLAIFAARYVPTAVSRIAAGAAFLSTNGHGNDQSQLQVVPSLPFPTDGATTTPAAVPVATTTKPAPAPVTHPAPTGTQTVTTPYPVPGSVKVPVAPAAQPLYGLPNLTTTITAVGYVDDNDVFHTDSSINSDQQLAVQFRIKNTGTNVTGAWRIQAVLPTRSDRTFDFTSDDQESLQPGTWVDYTLHLQTTDVRVADDQEITITAETVDKTNESNSNDNEADATIDVSAK